ncbi:MAG TPA: S8 family peptidase, partial [Bacteroidales bacterium]|nr:S8 family peptidase [Bacteroidales bacterium]
MAQKSHLYFRGEQLHRGEFKYSRRNVGSNNDDSRDANYAPMQETFRVSLGNFNHKRQLREERRNPNIDVAHLDYIQLNFFDVFKLSNFENKYRDQFGLRAVTFWDYNRSGLFAIENTDQFEKFLRDVQYFIDADNPGENANYSPEIRFIKSFDGYSREEILKLSGSHPQVVLDLIKSVPLLIQFVEPVRNSLEAYLNQKGIDYDLNRISETIELNKPEWDTLVEIADNFDIVQSISSHDSGIIRPTAYGLPIREYGFSIKEDNIDDLPIIGILDSGVSDQNPLSPLLIKAQNPFDLTGTDPFDDNIDHGTGVAGLAALGSKPYPDFRGEFDADARILSIKILHENHSPISQNGVINAIRRAYNDYSVRIFVLTITWDDFKQTHEEQSEYTLALDRIANELDLLIFISTGNLDSYFDRHAQLINYPEHFLNEASNIRTPADSMNNISVGAVAANFEDGQFDGFSKDRNYPAVYSLKNHMDWDDDSLKRNMINLQLIKPDILLPGGDVNDQTEPDDYGLQVLSANTGMFFNKETGTSFSAPLAANIAARLLKQYPSITSMQTIKALIINSAEKIVLGPEFREFSRRKRLAVTGRGKPIDTNAIFSDSHRVTFIIEGTVDPGKMEVYELALPAYLNEMYKSQGLLKVNGTLCFKFNPVPDSHISYCPIHFAFGFFKNIPA